MCDTVDSSDEEDTVGAFIPKAHVVDTDRSINNKKSFGTDEIDRSVQNISNVGKSMVINKGTIKDAQNDSDVLFANFQGTEVQNKSVSAQNVRGEYDKSENIIYCESLSDKNSDDIEDRNSLSYMAKDVQNLYLLNFDDSDVSIGEEEVDLYI